MGVYIPLCTGKTARQVVAQMPAGPPSVDWRYRKRRDPYDGPVNNPPPDDSQYVHSPENMRYLVPAPMDSLRDPGPGSIGDADGDERINVPQDDQRELSDHTPETPDARHQDFTVDITEYGPRPNHKPNRTHNVFDSQQDELLLETDEDNNFAETYPFATAVRLSSYRCTVNTRLAILRQLKAATVDPQTSELIKEYKQGNVNAAQALISINLVFITEVVRRRILRSGRPIFGPEDVDDLMQEAQIALLQAIQHYDGSKDLAKYLWKHVDGVVQNEVKKLIRKHKRERTVDDIEWMAGMAPEGHPVDMSDVSEVLRRAPEPMQKWIPLFDRYFKMGESYEDLAASEAGKALGATVRSLRYNIRMITEWLGRQPEIQDMQEVPDVS